MTVCGAKWMYRGGTRAKCRLEAGHEGKHHNGTVHWSDDTAGAALADELLAEIEAHRRRVAEIMRRHGALP
jgi:hypothetical protein